MTLLQESLDRLDEIADRPISGSEREAGLRCLVDTVGCALGGATQHVTLAVKASLTHDLSGVSVLGLEERYRPADAMVLHAAAIRCLDFNDYFTARNNYHPSEHVIPAVLAIAEQRRWTGEQIVDAIALGYRISLGFGEMWAGLLDSGWAPSATLGRISTAALLARMRGLGRVTQLNAMSIAALTAPTLGVVFKGEMSGMKSVVNGLAGKAAWEAVELARAGLTGPSDVLEGTAGFESQTRARPDLDTPALGADDIAFKAYPTVFLTHASIAAALEVAAAGDHSPAAMVAVRVDAPPKVVEMAGAPSRWDASTTHEAQFSLPVTVATSLQHGACGFAELSDAAVSSREVRRIVSLMDIRPSDSWTGYQGGRVTVNYENGRSTSREVALVPGTPGAFTDEQLFSKFRSLAGLHLDNERVVRAEGELRNLPHAPSLEPLLTAVRGDR